MIQRQQTLWLILATAAAALTFKFPFATGEEIVKNTTMKQLVETTAGNNFFTLILTIASAIISTITIFMFKDRKNANKALSAWVVNCYRYSCLVYSGYE